MSLYLGIKKLFQIGHRAKIEKLRRILLDRARCLDPNQDWLARPDWAALLQKDANLLDEVLDALRKDGLVQYAPNNYYRIGPPFSRL